MSSELKTLAFIVDNELNKKGDGSSLSHSSMDGVINAIYCPDEKLDEMRNHWARDIVAGKHLFLSEYGDPGQFRAFMDVDLRVRDKKSWSAKVLLPILELTQLVVCSMFNNLVDHDNSLPPLEKKLLMLILQRRRRKSGENGEMHSFGYHFHWPNLTISTRTAIVIRSIILERLDTTHSHILPPGDEPWSTIFDEAVYLGTRGPHLRGPLCSKCTRCECARRDIHCIHGKNRFVLMDDSRYAHIMGAYDGDFNSMVSVKNHYDIRNCSSFGRVLQFITATSIRTSTSEMICVVPHGYTAGYKSSCRGTTNKNGERIAGEEKLDERTKNAMGIAYDFMESCFGLRGQLSPVSEMRFSTKGRNPYFSIMSQSRRCTNKGSNHSTAGSLVTVCFAYFR